MHHVTTTVMECSRSIAPMGEHANNCHAPAPGCTLRVESSDRQGLGTMKEEVL